ncbi:TPA: type II toxin-antitoxin system PemK/MazF family toxin [Streptococcus suis]|nr:type II toxin-antitoxin system PemK/MazF family toxin [Streptococcus suis]
MKENPYFENAKQNYIKVEKLYKLGKAKHTSTKYRFLAPAVKRQSEQYLYEAENPKRKYWKFNRGSLVFVEFGVNVGGELSNNHWAIVLDKTDSPYKKTLTVIPITSKENDNTVPLQEIIGQQSFKYIDKEFAKLEQKITEENTSGEEFQLTISNLKEVIDYYGKYLKQSFAKCDSLQTISKDRILKKNPLDPVGKIKVSPETLDAINAKVKELYF